jgi:hypothetical protein
MTNKSEIIAELNPHNGTGDIGWRYEDGSFTGGECGFRTKQEAEAAIPGFEARQDASLEAYMKEKAEEEREQNERWPNIGCVRAKIQEITSKRRTCRAAARILSPSGYLLRWANAFQVCEGQHLRLADVLQCVDLIAWDNQRMGMGYRARRRGDYLVVLQKPPIRARATWADHSIADRWVEKVDQALHQHIKHPHIKPLRLIFRLIKATTKPGDLVVDPAAGSFVVMHAAHYAQREFTGCDIAYSATDPVYHGRQS